MMKYFLPLQILIILLSGGCTVSEAPLTVYDLRCENLTEPLGIGTNIPRLNWKIKSQANGTRQKAYQILAAGSIELLDENKADLWNSGKVESHSGIYIPYMGKKLTSRSICYWKIRVWDENNAVSGWSSTAFFSIGLLNESDWQAKYIGFPDSSSYTISPQFWKTFNLTAASEKIFLHVNSLGYHEVYINGRKAGDYVLTPAVSQFDKRSLVLTYDITSLAREGRNDLVIWTARGWYSRGLPGVEDNGPFVRAQVEKLEAGHWGIITVTDSSWSGRKSGYSTIGTWRPHRFGGEIIDASLLMNDLSVASLDNSSWTPVSTPEISGGQSTPQLTEPNRIIKTIKAVSVTKINDSTWLADMGTTLTGYAEINFPMLRPGEKILMEYCDHLDETGNTADQGQTDIFISAGAKDEIFCNKFNYHGFRFIKISNLKVKPETSNIRAHLIHTGYRQASSFECSDNEITSIHDMVNYTLRCLSLGGYLVDCPQIERLGYGGDGNASTETAQIMFDLAPLYSNWLQAWADCIRDDGGMPHTAPNPYPAGGGPYWCGFIITASWRTYNNYGDVRILEKYYPVMQKWLGYAEKYSPEGLLQRWPDTDYRNWYLGDWAVPEGTDQTDPASVDLVNNCFMTVCYETMHKIAIILGKQTDAGIYLAKKEKIRELVHKKFYSVDKGYYGSGSQIDLTYPLLAGIVPDSLTVKVKENLKDLILNKHKGHFACGLVGIPVFTEWAVINQEADLFCSMLLKKEYPGYLYMIENGATTTWEHWNGNRSRIHNCYNGIGSWFYQAVGGIRSDNSAAFQSLIIDPQIPRGITWANTTKETPYGTVSVIWRKENELFKMEISIPAGSNAKVIIPDKVSSYRMNGKEYPNDLFMTETGSGNYTFEWQENMPE